MGHDHPPKRSGREWAFSIQLSLTAHRMPASFLRHSVWYRPIWILVTSSAR